MEPLKVPRGFTTFTKALGEPTMLERMWEPTLRGDKMAWMRRDRKQKGQLLKIKETLKLIALEPGKAQTGSASSKRHF